MVCGTLIIPLSVGGVGQERPTTAVHAFIIFVFLITSEYSVQHPFEKGTIFCVFK